MSIKDVVARMDATELLRYYVRMHVLMAERGAEWELALAESKKYFNDLVYECFEGVLKQAYVGK